MKRLLCLAGLLALLAACADTSDEGECPVVTPENVYLMTGDLPPSSPCAQDYKPGAKP